MRVVLEHLEKQFGPTRVLQDLSLTIEDHELFFLLGPSGCGKTTLLRLLAGFYQPDRGSIWFGTQRMDGVPPHHRNTGMVFQNYALWPHLSVADNVGYGLEVRRLAPAVRRQRIAEALASVRMETYADRFPNQLSGGQQQRVALARALVIQPDVLLLDEPLSNLDARLRLEMREEIRSLQAQTRITTLYVTHDQKEALSLADRLAVMHDGRLVQVGSPRAIYRQPVSPFVANFMAETNWLPAKVAASSPEGLELETAFGPLHAPPIPALMPGQTVQVGFRPEAVQFVPADHNLLRPRVEHVSYLGEMEQYGLRLDGGILLKAFEANPQAHRPRGAVVTIHLPRENLLVFPEEKPGLD